MRLDPHEAGVKEAWHALRQTDAQWQDIPVPSTFNTVGSPLRDYEGATWFFRTFSLDAPPERTELIRLCFEGMMRKDLAITVGLQTCHPAGPESRAFPVRLCPTR